MDSKLKNYENAERLLAETLFKSTNSVRKYYFTSGHICYDAVVYNKNNEAILVEIKVRSFNIKKYDDYIIEVDKLRRLISTGEKYKFDKILYINFFTTDKPEVYEFIIFNITERLKIWKDKQPVTETKLMNAETYISNTRKVYKEVIMLKYDETFDKKGEITLK